MSAPDEVCMALLGETLGTEDKLKLAGTRLQKLMTSEEPACKDSTQLADEQPVRTKSAGETKSQSAVQALLGVIADEAEDEGESKDEDEDEDENENDKEDDDDGVDDQEPRAYTSELDYLQAMFALVTLLVQARPCWLVHCTVHAPLAH